jgi:hypothetical protein
MVAVQAATHAAARPGLHGMGPATGYLPGAPLRPPWQGRAVSHERGKRESEPYIHVGNLILDAA